MKTFKNAKEWARYVKEQLGDHQYPVEFNDNFRDRVIEILDDVGNELYDEMMMLINEKKRPYQSALKEINNKSRSIAARIDALFTDGVVNPDFFILGRYAKCYTDDGELTCYGDTKEMRVFLRELNRCPEFIKLVNKLKNDVNEHKQKEEAMKHFSPHVCKPLREFLKLEKHELLSEHMACLAALGSYHSVGLISFIGGLEHFRPLINRANFVKYCYYAGGITEELIEEYEKDENAFLMKPEVQKICNPFTGAF